MRFARALVRPPSASFADGLKRIDQGAPSLALIQHRHYCDALVECGLAISMLAAEDGLPDATFVEDTAIVHRDSALLTIPGAAQRRDEVSSIGAALSAQGLDVEAMSAPGTLDGGDVCETGPIAFIGLSERTSADGAQQLASWFNARGVEVRIVDIRHMGSILHLKSGLAWLGDGRLLVIDELAPHAAFADLECVVVPAQERYAANAVRVNDRVLLASGFPRTEQLLRDLGYRPLLLEMSEFAKMDGGPSCLSLRY